MRVESKVKQISFLTFCKGSAIYERAAEVAIQKCKKENHVFRSATVLKVEPMFFGLFSKVKADYRYI